MGWGKSTFIVDNQAPNRKLMPTRNKGGSRGKGKKTNKKGVMSGPSEKKGFKTGTISETARSAEKKKGGVKGQVWINTIVENHMSVHGRAFRGTGDP